MARVLGPGGVAAFDAITEDCLTDDVVGHWREERSVFRPLPRRWLTGYLERRGGGVPGGPPPPPPQGGVQSPVLGEAPRPGPGGPGGARPAGAPPVRPEPDQA